MITFGEQGGMIFPVGQGIGPTHPAKFTRSPKRAAILPPVKTDVDPIAMIPGPPGTQPGITQGMVWLVTTAANRPLMMTVGTIINMIGIGIGGCGIGVGVGAGG